MKTIFRPGLMLLLFISSLSIKAQVPALSSYPSASAVLFLDFDGHTVTGTSWNASGPIYCGSSGLDNAQITEVFNRVAEDYRPFDINITTDSTKFLAAPLNKRMRVILTVTSGWYGAAGGVAFVGSFNWGDDTPCFIFSGLLNYNVKNIAEAASHEAGHTLGLYHQATYDVNCVKTSDYNYGQGSGEIGWAPIMGVGYYRNSTTWFDGPNSYGCTNYQSDLNILISNNGFSYRNDDFDETFSAAPAQSFTNDQFTTDGMISTATDKDMVKFTLPNTRRVIINAVPKNVGTGNDGSNLDISMQLFNGSNNLIGSYNPELTLNAMVDTMLNPGTYYILIDGVGNQFTPEYGSLGEYSISVSQNNPVTLALRKLELSGEVTGDKHQLNWIIDADEQITQQTLEVSTDGVHFSPVTQPASGTRSFIYKPYITATAQYRLNVLFENGHRYYSNIVTLRATGSIPRPKLLSNFISSGAITVTSPGIYQYAIYDFNGKTVGQGQLANGLNTINAAGITSGLYVIRFVSGSEQWTDKLIRP